MTEPVLMQVKSGWAAIGDGWAVRAPSKEEAQEKFKERARQYREIDARPFLHERLAADAAPEDKT